MKNAIGIVFFFLLCWSGLMAQPKYFEKSFGWTELQNGYKADIINDSTYLVIGRNFLASDFYIKSHGIKFDKYGNELYREVYPTNYGQLYVEDIVKYTDGFAITGCLENVIGRCTAFIITLNVEGFFHDMKFIADTSIYSRTPAIAKAEDGFIIGGNIFQNQKEKLYLIKTDLQGNKVWEKIYEEYSTSQNLIKDIQPASGGGFYISATIDLNFNSSPRTGDILLMKIDEEGNKEWQKIFNIGDVDQVVTTISTSDGGFLMSGAVGHNDIAFIKINKHRQVEWVKEDIYRNCGGANLYQLPDNTYITAGCHKPKTTRVEAKIAKLDTKGNVLWQRSYGGEKDDYFYDMIQTPDGGYLMTGRTESLPESGVNVYLLKTNCMGLLTEPLAQFSAEQDSENSHTYHFTNHSQYVYPDSIDGGHFLWDFGDGVTSMDLHPTHEYANKGESRIVTLTAVVCSDTSTFDIKVVVGEEIVGIEGEYDLPAFSFGLFPNPARGDEVEIVYDLPKEGVLQLFDLQGKVMKYWILGIGYSQIDLDLGDFVEGMYFYRLSMDGVYLKSGKLVVE